MNYELVHKVLFSSDFPRTIAFAKFVNTEDMSDIKIFTGIIDKNIMNVVSSDLRELKERGVEIAANALDIFLFKDDYDEHDLLTDNEDITL